jgi:hypothetical protein
MVGRSLFVILFFIFLSNENMIIKQKSSVHLVIVSIAGYVLGITVLACFFSTICQTITKEEITTQGNTHLQPIIKRTIERYDLNLVAIPPIFI